VLRQHSLVSELACAAVPDDVRGEEVLACIVPREPVGDMIEAAADIVAHTLRELAYFKAPGYVAFVDSLPLTATNKVQRGELKAWARELPGTAACIDTRHLKRRQ
jgi:acyl-coenzyme A synthetase/AMP-(fatty) acid ligase